MADEPKPPAHRVIFQGRKIDLALVPVPLKDGTTAEREVVLHPGSVALIPILADGQICLVRNFRHGLAERLLELPAGTIDPSEDPLTCAARELAEETGFRAGSIRELSRFYVSPGVTTELMHLYLCEDLTPGPAALEPDESLEPVLVSLEEGFAMIHDGRIKDAKTMLGLMMIERAPQAGNSA